MKNIILTLLFVFLFVGIGFSQTKDQTFNATWTDNSSNELRFIFEKQNTDSTFSELQRVGANVTSVSVVVNGTEGQEFCFAVKAFNNSTEGVEQVSTRSNIACTKIPIGIPSAPGNFTIVAVNSSSSNLKWDNPNNSSIRIYRTAMQGRGDTHEIVLAGGSKSYIDNFNLRKNWTYCYAIQELESNDIFGSGCVRMPNS